MTELRFYILPPSSCSLCLEAVLPGWRLPARPLFDLDGVLSWVVFFGDCSSSTPSSVKSSFVSDFLFSCSINYIAVEIVIEEKNLNLFLLQLLLLEVIQCQIFFEIDQFYCSIWWKKNIIFFQEYRE
jgi:hypothetical protein